MGHWPNLTQCLSAGLSKREKKAKNRRKKYAFFHAKKTI